MPPLNFADRWPQYYEVMAGTPPRDTLLKVLERFDTPGFAIDLGCGEGRDTVELLRRGWRVLAIDGTDVGIEQLRQRPDLTCPEQLTTQVVRFGDLTTLPPAQLVNASYSLPFCFPDEFPRLWQLIWQTLEPGGRFAGQLFGDRDSWAGIPTHTHHCRTQVEALLQAYEVELLQEEEKDQVTALNELKHWHLFHIIARKPNP